MHKISIRWRAKPFESIRSFVFGTYASVGYNLFKKSIKLGEVIQAKLSRLSL